MSEREKVRRFLEKFGVEEKEVMSNQEAFKLYLTKLAYFESRGKYKEDNKHKDGYIGKYQMGTQILQDIGLITNWAHKDWRTNAERWKKGNKYGIKSYEDFLHNPKAQERAVVAAVQKQWGYAKTLKKYVGQTIEFTGKSGRLISVKVTKPGIIAAIHLKGSGAVATAFEERKDIYDGNKTSITKYMINMGGPEFDTSQIAPMEVKVLASERKVFTERGSYIGDKTDDDGFQAAQVEKPTKKSTLNTNDTPATAGNTYTIQKGDTLGEIAERYKTSPEELVQLNPSIKEPDVIRPGQILQLPESKEQKSPATGAQSKPLSETEGRRREYAERKADPVVLPQDKNKIRVGRQSPSTEEIPTDPAGLGFNDVSPQSKTKSKPPRKYRLSGQIRAEQRRAQRAKFAQRRAEQDQGIASGTVAEQDQMPAITTEFVNLIRAEIVQIFEGKEEALLEEITLLKAADTSSEGKIDLLEGAESECCSLLDRVKTLEHDVKNMPKRIEQIQEHRRRFPLGNIWDYPN